MNMLRMLVSILAIAFGVFMFFYGGYDDSPGAQMLGLVAAGFGVAGLIKGRKKAPKP